MNNLFMKVRMSSVSDFFSEDTVLNSKKAFISFKPDVNGVIKTVDGSVIDTSSLVFPISETGFVGYLLNPLADISPRGFTYTFYISAESDCGRASIATGTLDAATAVASLDRFGEEVIELSPLLPAGQQSSGEVIVTPIPGPPGAPGKDGRGFTYLGNLDSVASLPPNANTGDAYTISGNLWLKGESGWVLSGQITIPLSGESAYEIWAKQEGNEGKSVLAFLASLKGDAGAPGAPGAPGVGIESISSEKSGFSIHLTNGESYSITLPTTSTDGDSTGKDGRGILAITTDDDGNAVIAYTDNTSDTIPLPRGAEGATGKDGRGITSVVNSTEDIAIVSYTDNTSDTLSLPRGKDGKDGINGKEGRGIVSITDTDGDGNATITYTDKTSDILTLPKVSDWNAITNRPSTFTPISHHHEIGEINGLHDALTTKIDKSAFTGANILTSLKEVDGDGSQLDADSLDGVHADGFAKASHTHKIEDIEYLQDMLNYSISGTIDIINDAIWTANTLMSIIKQRLVITRYVAKNGTQRYEYDIAMVLTCSGYSFSANTAATVAFGNFSNPNKTPIINNILADSNKPDYAMGRYIVTDSFSNVTSTGDVIFDHITRASNYQTVLRIMPPAALTLRSTDKVHINMNITSSF